jgi:hypothetical protein
MIDLRLGDLVEAATRLAQMGQMLRTVEMIGASKAGALNSESLSAVLGAAEHLIKVAKSADLDATEASAERLSTFIDGLKKTHITTGKLPNDPQTVHTVEHHVGVAAQTLKDQLKRKFVLLLSAHEARLFEPDQPLFGQGVHDKFPDARDDIEEAGKCLALQRNKATVCHLMLAMEQALRGIANKIGAAVQNKDDKWLTWLVIANNMEPKIRAMQEGPNKVVWWEVHSMLSSVGKAWRNPSMHPARSYDYPQATKVFEAVKGFMHDLASVI